MILAIDPGKDKAGVAIYDPGTQQVVEHQIVETPRFVEFVDRNSQQYCFQVVLLGDGTHSKEFQVLIQRLLPGAVLRLVDEAYSTLEARKLYFKLVPPKGLKRLLPVSLQTPGRPVDDLVAIVLLQRYLGDMPKIGR